MSTTKEPEKSKDKPKKRFSSPSGDKLRSEHRRSGMIKTLLAGALGGAAYGVNRSAEKFLPGETRRAIDETERVYNRLRMSRALSGDKASNDDVIEAYANQASRLSRAPVMGMQGKDFVKLLRTKLPVKNKWQPFYSDAHYDAFARGPAYGAAQVIDEKAEELTKRPGVATKLKEYLIEKWPEKFSDKINLTSALHGGTKMDVGPSLRESLAYNGTTMPLDIQPGIAKDIIRGPLFNKDRVPLLGGFSDHYQKIKKDLAGGLLNHSFPNYVGLGHKAKGVHSALRTTIPVALGAAGVGLGGYGLYQLLQSLKRTAYEKRMMAKAEQEGDDIEKKAVIKQEGEEWVLYTKDGTRVLGRHASKRQAILQEYAIEKSVARQKEASAWYPKLRYLTSWLRAPNKVRRASGNIKELVTTALEEANKQQSPLIVQEPEAEQTKLASTLSRLRKARNVTHTHPTEGQASAGNYRKGTFKWNGLNIKIENPEGSTRRGVSKSGKAWATVMKCDYGYFAGNGGAAPKGKDGDAIDVFIGPDPDSDVVAVIHQTIDGKFDEHKVIIGIQDKEEARALYLSNYQKGWTCGPIHMTNVSEFKQWLNNADTSKRFQKAASDDEPSTIGKGLGTLFSDFVPFAPSGARRAGAASLMSERLGKDPGLLLKYPMLSQILAGVGGGALAGLAAEHAQPPVTTALAGIAPYLAVQGLKRHKINKIDREYKETKTRKRLREVDAEGMVDDALGSHRLGMAQAFDAMRNRKMRDIGALAEAGDALPVATTMVGLGPAASLPLTQLLDHLESGRFREKKADWSDQINAPAIPMYLAAAGAGLGGLILSSSKLHKDLNDPSLKSMPRGEWDGLIKHVSGRDLLSAQVPGLNNAFFARARNDEEARSMLGYALHDPVVARRTILNPSGSKLIKQLKDHGTAMFDPSFGKASIVGHEAGHAKIEHTPGIMQALQRKLYRYSPVIAPFSAVGGMAAGLASKSPLMGLLAGTGIGLAGGAGMMFPEYMATHHGMKGLETYQGGKWKQDGDWKRQLTALGTYGSLNVLPSAVAGLLGGYVGKRRARKKQEEIERETREAAENPDSITRTDEDARKLDKAANLNQKFQAILRAKQIASQMGRDSADRFIVQHTGSYLKPSINQFFNDKGVQALGIKKGMKAQKIIELLKSMQPPQ